MAKRFFRTQTADRPDLALVGSVSQLDVMGYAFPKLFPIVKVAEKAGTITVASANLTNSKGTKARANGTALSGTSLTGTDTTYTAARYEGRGLMYENDGAAFDDEKAADEAGALLSQRLAWNKVEDDAFKTVFTATRKTNAATLTDQKVVSILQKKAKSVRAYGKATLVMTSNTWLDFCEIPEIRCRLAAFAGAGNDIGYLMQDPAKVLGALSVFLHFEGGVVVFDSELVDSDGTYDGIVMVTATRPEAASQALATIKTKATYGYCAVYIPEDAADADKPFDMRSYYSNSDKANVYDSEAFLGIVESFSAAVVPTKLASTYTWPVTVNNTVTVEQAAAASESTETSGT